MGGEDGLSDLGLIARSQHISIKRKTGLEPANGLGAGEDRQVEGFVGLIVDFILNRF
jgi:hypothetical protein